jgi:hypothetical protein
MKKKRKKGNQRLGSNSPTPAHYRIPFLGPLSLSLSPHQPHAAPLVLAAMWDRVASLPKSLHSHLLVGPHGQVRFRPPKILPDRRSSRGVATAATRYPPPDWGILSRSSRGRTLSSSINAEPCALPVAHHVLFRVRRERTEKEIPSTPSPLIQAPMAVRSMKMDPRASLGAQGHTRCGAGIRDQLVVEEFLTAVRVPL